MNKSKCIAGPWHKWRKQEKYWSTYYVLKSGGGIVAECNTLEAEAQAIAALPDLLVALEQSYETLQWAAQEAKGKVKAEIVVGWLHHAEQAKAALVKAGYTP
jgi:hypothetical protein